MNKNIARNFATAALTLSTLLGIPAYAAGPAPIAATTEEMTVPDSLGHTVLKKESVVFSACTADNHRVTSQFFLAADALGKSRLNAPYESATKYVNYMHQQFAESYAMGAETVTAAIFAEDIAHKTVPLELRQYMNYARRAVTPDDGTANVSWRLKNTTVSAKRDPSCKVVAP